MHTIIYVSRVHTEFLMRCSSNITRTCTTPYRLHCNGLVERFNRTLSAMLVTAVQDHQLLWERHLRLCMAYNTSVHPTTGDTPFYLVFGHRAQTSIDIMCGTSTPSALSPTNKLTVGINIWSWLTRKYACSWVTS